MPAVIVHQPNSIGKKTYYKKWSLSWTIFQNLNLGPQEYLNPKHEGVYAAPQPPHTNYDTSGIPGNLLPLMYADYLVVKQKKEWLESKL